MTLRLALLLAALATPALAADPDPAPTPTASKDSETAAQIDAFIRSSPVHELPTEATLAGVVPPADDGKPHGEVSVAVGTGGYRSVYARTDMKVGDNARVSIAVQDTRFGRRAGRRGAHLVGGPYAAAPVDRQRCDLEGMTPARSMDVEQGSGGPCVRPLPPR